MFGFESILAFLGEHLTVFCYQHSPAHICTGTEVLTLDPAGPSKPSQDQESLYL